MDTLGRIAVPEVVPSGVFPLTPDYGSGMSIEPQISTFQFESGNAKIEQRFVLGNGYRKFTVRRSVMSQAEIGQLADFWLLNKGPVGAFTYNAPDGQSYLCRFADTKLTWDYLVDDLASAGITLQELPASTPVLPLNSTVERFPSGALSNALLSNTQTIIPLIRIRVKEAAVPDIFVSDRRVQVGGTLYQARLLSWDGISQSITGEADQGQFSFGNADRVFTQLANDTTLWLASLEFSLYHAGTGTKIDLWKGDVQEWSFTAASPEFKVTAYDGIYELSLPYPCRKVSRTCWKKFNTPNCPYAQHGTPGFSTCDRSWDACQARGMSDYFGGIVANPQTVITKDNSTGVWGYGRNSLQSSSVVSDSIYSEVLPDIWYDDRNRPLAVNGKIVAGRDEGDFYCALGIVGRGPLGEYSSYLYQKDSPGSINNPLPCWHTLDGMPPHGPGRMGLRESLGHDPCQANDPDAASNLFSLGQGGAGIQTYGATQAAGVAFVEIRRTDEKGLQLQPLSQHSMQLYVARGLAGWKWTAPGQRSLVAGLTNPIWIAVNSLLMAKGAWSADTPVSAQESLFDVNEAVAAAAVCDQTVSPMVRRTIKYWESETGDDGFGNTITLPTGQWVDQEIASEPQFVFMGAMVEQKPLRQWITEILMNCLGYFTFSNGKLRLGVRFHSGAQSAFTTGNIVFNSLELGVLKPEFNHFTASFGNSEYNFAADSVDLADQDHAALIGGDQTPVYLDGNCNLSGTVDRSHAARIVTARLREELGGVGLSEQKNARQFAFKTTILALEVHPGMVCSLTHEDLPGGYGEFRVLSWKLNQDYSIDIQGRTTTDSMYDMLAGPKPADVVPEAPPTETVFPPADFGYRLTADGDGKVTISDLFCASNPSTVHQGTFDVYYVPESSSVMCDLSTGMDASTETLGYTGFTRPSAGEWILIGSELMEVVSVTPSDERSGTCTVKRGQLGTTAAAHARLGPVDIANPSADGQSFDVTGAFHPGDGLTTDPGAEWNIIATYDGSRLTAMWPFSDLTGQKVYSDPTIYRVSRKTIVIPFAPRFFTSGARAGFTYEFDLPNAGIAAVSGVLENTRGDRSDPLIQTFTAKFPFRLRTGGNSGLVLTHPVPPQGVTQNAFLPVTIPAGQSFRGAGAEWHDDFFLPTPASIGTVSLDDPAPGGTITINAAKAYPQGMIQVTIGDPATDANVVSVPAMGTIGLANANYIAESLSLWLNSHEEFWAFFSAYPVAGTNQLTITDKTGRGGKLTVSCSGEVSATATGMTTPLGITKGRRYAATFYDGTHESSPSPLSPSTGPTGGAPHVDVKDLPSTSRSDVTTVAIYATPDGQDSPLYRCPAFMRVSCVSL